VPSGGKLSRKSRIIFSHSIEPPISVKLRRRNAEIPHHFGENREKIKIFLTQFFRVTRIFHLPNFDTTPLPVRTVDGESLSEIAIHNFEKNRKIESRILCYGQKRKNLDIDFFVSCT